MLHIVFIFCVQNQGTKKKPKFTAFLEITHPATWSGKIATCRDTKMKIVAL